MDALKKILPDLFSWLMKNGLRMLVCILVLVVGLRLIKWLIKKIVSGKRFGRLDASLRSFLGSALHIAMAAVLVITIAGILGIPMASFVTILASCGVAVGLALQGSLSNLAGGVMLLFFRPFKVGDYIEATGVSGTVKDISVFYTILTTPDNKTITVPNGSLTNNNIVNYSTATGRRVDLTFAVEYGTDIEKMKALLLEVANAHPLVIRDPDAPFARLAENGESAMVFALRVWCRVDDYWAVYFDLLEQVKARLDRENIRIPFPQVEVHNK